MENRRNQTMPCQNGCNGNTEGGQEALMQQIYESSFAVDDVALFLDTHPDNAEAMQYFRSANTMRQNALETYERQFGPLLIDNVNANTWNWVTDKWPWEGGY